MEWKTHALSTLLQEVQGHNKVNIFVMGGSLMVKGCFQMSHKVDNYTIDCASHIHSVFLLALSLDILDWYVQVIKYMGYFPAQIQKWYDLQALLEVK